MATRRPMGGGRMLRAVGRAVGAGVGGVKEAITAGAVGRPGKLARIENPDWPQINNRLLSSSRSKLRNILEVLMESTPQEIDATRLGKGLCEMDGVVAVHELHIWAITMGKVLLACHVTITPEADADRILDEVIGYIRKEYNISHVTIQIERL